MSDQSLLVHPLSCFSFQPVLHDWCNKGRGMCYPVCGMMYTKEPLLLIEKSSPCGGSGFPFSLSEWSFTICPTPYNHITGIMNDLHGFGLRGRLPNIISIVLKDRSFKVRVGSTFSDSHPREMGVPQ